MKKIPTLFEREFFDDHTALAKPIVTFWSNIPGIWIRIEPLEEGTK